jgi:membrane associated rhomboid family serine protease
MFPLKDNIPLSVFPLVTIGLVAVNVVAYVLSLRHGGSFFAGPSRAVALHYGAIPFELTHPGHHCNVLATPPGPRGAVAVLCPDSEKLLLPDPPQPATWETVASSMFQHGSFLQIFAGMYFLAIFGPSIEQATGRLRFLALYLLGGIVALAVQVLLSPNSTVPVLGATGAVAAVLGAHLLLHPRAKVIALAPVPFFATIVALPTVLLLGLWFLVQLWFTLAGLASPFDGDALVAYFAPVGAFVFGLLSIRTIARSDRAPIERSPHQPVY